MLSCSKGQCCSSYWKRHLADFELVFIAQSIILKSIALKFRTLIYYCDNSL